MGQAKRLSQLVQRDAIQVDRRPHSPHFVRVKVHVTSYRLGIHWRRIERVGQHAPRAIEWIRVAMRTAAEENVDRSRGGRVLSQRKPDGWALYPLVQGADDLP